MQLWVENAWLNISAGWGKKCFLSVKVCMFACSLAVVTRSHWCAKGVFNEAYAFSFENQIFSLPSTFWG